QPTSCAGCASGWRTWKAGNRGRRKRPRRREKRRRIEQSPNQQGRGSALRSRAPFFVGTIVGISDTGRKTNHRDTETQRHRDNTEKRVFRFFSVHSLCLCVSVVGLAACPKWIPRFPHG